MIPLNVHIRPASMADIASVTELYAHHVMTGTGTFALTPPSEAEMSENFVNITKRGLPYLTLIVGEELAGFAYVAPFKPREAYAYSAEISVYIDPKYQAKGLGKALLSELCQKASEAGLYSLIAIIGDSHNHASIELHKALGFVSCGIWPKAGFKFGQWRDIVLMTRSLKNQDTLPEGSGWNR